MRHLISTFTAQDQIRGADTLLEPHGVTGPIMWAVSWGFTHPRLVCNIDSVERGSAGLSCIALLLNMMWCLWTWTVYLGHGVGIHSFLGRKGGPAWRSSTEESSGPSFITCLLSLWTCPVTCLDLWCICSKTRTLGQRASRRFCCYSEMSSVTMISKRSARFLHLGTT